MYRLLRKSPHTDIPDPPEFSVVMAAGLFAFPKYIQNVSPAKLVDLYSAYSNDKTNPLS
jgi:hypothetical protein